MARPCSPHLTCIWGLWSKHSFTQRHAPCLLGYLRDHAELGVTAFLQTPFPAPWKVTSLFLVQLSQPVSCCLSPSDLRCPMSWLISALCCLSFPGTE